MYEVTPYNTAITPADELRPALFNDFIKYVDRSERTAATYITDLRQFAAWLAFKAIRRPERPDVIAYRDYLGREHEAIQYDRAAGWRYRTDHNGKRYTITCKPATVRQYLRAVRAFFSWTSTEGYYPDIARGVHAPKVRHDVHKKDALQRGDVARIADTIERETEAGRRLYAMYLLCVICGLRTIEIHRADVGDLKTVGGTTYLYLQGKGHDDKDAPVLLIKEVYNAVQDYLQHRSEKVTAKSPLFTSTSNRSKGGRIATTTISTMLKTLLVNAGYDSDRLTAHSLRHTSGTGAHKAGIDLYGVQHLMRHCDPATSEIYIHDDDHKAAEEKGRKGIYDYYFNGAELNPVMPELEAEIMTMTAKEQAALLAQIRAQKGAK